MSPGDNHFRCGEPPTAEQRGDIAAFQFEAGQALDARRWRGRVHRSAGAIGAELLDLAMLCNRDGIDMRAAALAALDAAKAKAA